jgi:hypothetical protein
MHIWCNVQVLKMLDKYSNGKGSAETWVVDIDGIWCGGGLSFWKDTKLQDAEVDIQLHLALAILLAIVLMMTTIMFHKVMGILVALTSHIWKTVFLTDLVIQVDLKRRYLHLNFDSVR